MVQRSVIWVAKCCQTGNSKKLWFNKVRVIKLPRPASFFELILYFGDFKFKGRLLN